MKAIVLGVGRMGQAIVWAMDKFGFDVIAFDKDTKNFSTTEGLRSVEFHLSGDDEEQTLSYIKDSKPDIVISSLPYHQLKKAAFFCIDNNIKYCDLGGRVDVSDEIKQYASKKGKASVFTDLGLAPGFVNIEAEHGLNSVPDATSVKMMVGGLPSSTPTNNIWNHPRYCPLNYVVTWSVDGLINEYRDDCLILKGGKIIKTRGMDGLEVVNTDIGELEAFYTSGGMSHSIESMMKRGVKNCSYKTLRYKGHRNIVQWLIRRCGLSDAELTKVFENGCESGGEKDLVIIRTEIKKEETVWKKEKIVYADDRFSAMQKATAFSISSIAKMMAEKDFPETPVLNYSDVCYSSFVKNISTLENYNIENP